MEIYVSLRKKLTDKKQQFLNLKLINMNKSIFKCSFLFVFALIFFIQVQAQVKPVVKTGGDIMNPAIKAAVAKQAAIDKVLNAKLNKVTFIIWGDNHTPAALGGFKNKGVDLDGNLQNKFHFSFRNMTGTLEKNTITWAASVTGSNDFTNIDYKTFLENGFTVKVDFTNKYPNAMGKEFTANYSVGFTFTDGTQVTIPLQDITLEGQKGNWKSTGDVNITKSFAGSVFPDPANPLVLSTIK